MTLEESKKRIEYMSRDIDGPDVRVVELLTFLVDRVATLETVVRRAALCHMPGCASLSKPGGPESLLFVIKRAPCDCGTDRAHELQKELGK